MAIFCKAFSQCASQNADRITVFRIMQNALAMEPSRRFRYFVATEPPYRGYGTVLMVPVYCGYGTIKSSSWCCRCWKDHIKKISWFVPHALMVLPADADKFSLYKCIALKVSPCCIQNETVWYYYSTSSYDILLATGCENAQEKPRWIIVGFQTEKSGY